MTNYIAPIDRPFICKSPRLYIFLKQNGFTELDSYVTRELTGETFTNWLFDFAEVQEALTYYTQSYSNKGK